MEAQSAWPGCPCVDFHGVYASGRRSLPDRVFESLDGLGFAFAHDLDAPVRKIANRPMKAFSARLFAREVTKPHSLNPSAHEISPHHAHRAPMKPDMITFAVA
jgi:hypothetical protein